MSEPKLEYAVKKLPKFELVIGMRVARGLRFKMWLAKRLIRVAGWLLGAEVQFVDYGADYQPEAADLPPSWMR